MRGPRAGRPGCGWPRCRWPGTRIRRGSRRSSPAASGRWRSTCWPRCWTGRARKSADSCCEPACSSASAARSPTPSPEARDWAPAARLLADHWPGLQLDGQAATVHALLARFPAETRAADAELAVLAAADELAAGSLAEAERLLELAALGTP